MAGASRPGRPSASSKPSRNICDQPSMKNILDWFGFGGHGDAHSPADHEYDHASGAHGHSHGVIDPSITTTDRGIWAIKWSFVILAITAAVQIVVVFTSGSVALLADAIHNVGDATTAIPL